MGSKWKYINQAALASREILHAELKEAAKLNKADREKELKHNKRKFAAKPCVLCLIGKQYTPMHGWCSSCDAEIRTYGFVEAVKRINRKREANV